MARRNLGRGGLRVLWLGGVLGLMAGCGQKGVLVLPPAETSAPTAPIASTVAAPVAAPNTATPSATNTGARNHD